MDQPVNLKKNLEWELSLESSDLKSHPWYHGAITRARAEELVCSDGEFLVRDCASQPGNYVLTLRNKGQNLHFVISKIILQPNTVYERIQYSFEEDGYDTVPDIITSYVGSEKPVTALSGAKIKTPINRMYPLSFGHDSCNKGSPRHSLNDQKDRFINKSGQYYECFSEGAPLKPSRRNKNALYHTFSSDSGNGSEDSADFERRTLNVIAMPFEPTLDDESLSSLKINFPSALDLDNFQTLLLPDENKPLDTHALRSLHAMLLEYGSRVMANHITRADMELTINPLKGEGEYYCKYGLELCGLEHGHQHRLDLIERMECLKLLVALTILTCSTEKEMAEILNKWIEVAIDLKTALGNLFGFCNVMLGLCVPQVRRLKSPWHILRQKYTDSAFNFEAKLKPTLKSMNDGTNPLAPNTTIPHLVPIIVLHELSNSTETDNRKEEWDKTESFSYDWEEDSCDLGLEALHTHLDLFRRYCKAVENFARNADIVLADSKVEDFVMDAFRTEFQLKFLWGSRGCRVCPQERYAKFKQVLTLMSEKFEPTADYDN